MIRGTRVAIQSGIGTFIGNTPTGRPVVVGDNGLVYANPSVVDVLPTPKEIARSRNIEVKANLRIAVNAVKRYIGWLFDDIALTIRNAKRGINTANRDAKVGIRKYHGRGTRRIFVS